MRNYFPKRTSGAPLHTLSKLYDVPVGFVSPPLWGSVLLYLRTPKDSCCSILDDLSCSYPNKICWKTMANVCPNRITAKKGLCNTLYIVEVASSCTCMLVVHGIHGTQMNDVDPCGPLDLSSITDNLPFSTDVTNLNYKQVLVDNIRATSSDGPIRYQWHDDRSTDCGCP